MKAWFCHNYVHADVHVCLCVKCEVTEGEDSEENLWFFFISFGINIWNFCKEKLIELCCLHNYLHT